MADTKNAPIPSETEPVTKAPAPKRRAASLADLKSKKARTNVVVVPMTDEDGDEYEVTVKLKALSSRAYDALEAKFPPTKDQKNKGLVYDIDAFAPALVSACALEPAMTVEDAAELYTSEEWSSGEFGSLFFAAQKLCNAGLAADFTEAG